MVKKIISLFLLTCLFAVQADAATNHGLKAAFDELNYSLTVEWDQKDKDFYAEKMKKFAHELNELRAQGLSNKEMLTFAKSELKNAKMAADLEGALAVIESEKMTPAEANAHLMQVMKKSYHSGAAWSGGGIAASVILALIISAIIGAAIYGYVKFVSPFKKEWNQAVAECEADPECKEGLDNGEFDGGDDEPDSGYIPTCHEDDYGNYVCA